MPEATCRDVLVLSSPLQSRQSTATFTAAQIWRIR